MGYFKIKIFALKLFRIQFKTIKINLILCCMVGYKNNNFRLILIRVSWIYAKREDCLIYGGNFWRILLSFFREGFLHLLLFCFAWCVLLHPVVEIFRRFITIQTQLEQIAVGNVKRPRHNLFHYIFLLKQWHNLFINIILININNQHYFHTLWNLLKIITLSVKPTEKNCLKNKSFFT